MIANANAPYAPRPFKVSRRPSEVARTLADLREEAGREVTALFKGVSGEQINTASVPGISRHGVSRALNGCDGNPLYRLPSWFVLCRRLGVPKARLQRVIDWLQEKLDEAYADAPTPSVREVLEKEQELDCADDAHQLRAAYGDPVALRKFLEVKREQMAFDRVVVAAVAAATR